MRKQLTMTAACVLACLAGSAWSASVTAQPRDGARPTEKVSTRPVFVSGDKMRGMNVQNSKDETVGSIDELILDRGSGQIAYVVLKSGAILGMGGKYVVVPYSQFGWDNVDKHPTLETSKEQVKMWPEFQRERWVVKEGADNGLSRTLAEDYYKPMVKTKAYPPDQDWETARVKGKVVKIIRRPVIGGPEEVIVTVSADDNRTEQVVVGPAWYLAGNTVMLYRDAPVDFHVIRTDEAGQPIVLARSMNVGGNELVLYDAKGWPRWVYDKNTDTTVVYMTPFIFSKDIDGAHVEARGLKCGKVNDLVIDCQSGRTAFLSIDPDQNVLGIGDTKRLVPWSVVAGIGKDTVMLDASKAMITSAQTTPSDLKTLANEDVYPAVYRSYDVAIPTFERPRR